MRFASTPFICDKAVPLCQRTGRGPSGAALFLVSPRTYGCRMWRDLWAYVQAWRRHFVGLATGARRSFGRSHLHTKRGPIEASTRAPTRRRQPPTPVGQRDSRRGGSRGRRPTCTVVAAPTVIQVNINVARDGPELL